MSSTTSRSSSFELSAMLKRDWGYGIILLAQVPAALGYLKRIWSSGHYQFAILFIPVVLFMMYSRLNGLKNFRCGSATITGLLLAAACAFMVLSTFVAPMFWIIAFMILALAYVYDYYGGQGVKVILPLWLIMALVIPLPRGLDSLLVTQMQLVASEMASWILDSVGHIHFREGVVLITWADRFMTEEACSGVRSLFSSLGAVGIYCAFKRYPAWRFVFNLLQTLFWVLVGNAIRIAVVVFVADNYTKAIAHGRPHELLGLVIFGLIVLLVISTDRILQAAIDMRGKVSDEDESFRDEEIELQPIRNPESTPIRKVVLGGAVVVALFLGFCSFRLMTVESQSHLRNPLFQLPAFPVSEEDDLPATIGNWELEKFEPIFRSEEVILAANSYTWTYRNGNVAAVVSIDGPWEFWHDITACYRGTGWTTDTAHRFDLTNEESADSGPLNHSRIKLSRVTGEQGLVFFAQHDLQGQEVRPNMLGGLVSLELMKLNFLNSFRTIFGMQGKFSEGFQQYDLPLSTVQVFVENTNSLTDEQISEIEKFYFEVRRLLVKSQRFHQNPTREQVMDEK